MNIDKLEKLFEKVIDEIVDESTKIDLKDTPRRISLSYQEIFSGVGVDPKSIIKNTFPIDNDNLVIEKNIDFYSMCEHHFLPFFGQISVAYIPNGKILGFGDVLKLINILSRRPQIQERLTDEIAEYIYQLTDCKGAMVTVNAKHLCMTMRGEKKENTEIITSSYKGVFLENQNDRIEVLTLLK